MKTLLAPVLASLCLVLSAKGGTVNAAFTSAATIPVTATAYTATGNDVNLSLGFAPGTGTTLTVVKNTGLGFISGQFSNLAQGQTVDLSFNAVSYKFVANYYGGSGNDLVLLWAGRSSFSWGDNTYGQLGNTSTGNSTVPVAVASTGALAGKTVTAVATGNSHITGPVF